MLSLGKLMDLVGLNRIKIFKIMKYLFRLITLPLVIAFVLISSLQRLLRSLYWNTRNWITKGGELTVNTTFYNPKTVANAVVKLIEKADNL